MAKNLPKNSPETLNQLIWGPKTDHQESAQNKSLAKVKTKTKMKTQKKLGPNFFLISDFFWCVKKF